MAQNTAGTTDGADQTFTTAAATAPVVVTGAASGITAKTATLNGTVNANGASTIYWFQYGTTTSYGLQTGTHGAGSGTSAHSVSAGISGLVAGATYHFRLVAQNSAGTTDGADQTFTTTAASAPQVTTGTATGVSAKAATLNGTVNPNGATTTYWFQYGTTTSYGLQTSTRDAGAGTSGRSVSAGISGLAAGTTYHYRLVAQNSAGTTNGQDQTFTTTAANAPAVTTGAASAIGPRDATVNGTRQPQRRKHHLLVPVRHDHKLWPADRNPQRRLGHQRAAGLCSSVRSHGRDHLPLSAGRPEQRRNDPGWRPDLHHQLGESAGRDHRRRQPNRATRSNR